MKIAEVPNTWILEEGLRLDPRPYIGGAMRLRKLVIKLPHSRLETVTKGFRGGIFTHLFSPKRTYVSDRKYGVPFLGASSMLQADLSDLPLLSNRDADSRSYRSLTIRQGMTLISCSGSVGRLTYARGDMDGMASAGDLLKVQPDPDRITPGYLYAFLRSKVGSALVSGGTYGTIVQHLEREHIASIPVPRLGRGVETKAHELIERAAQLRSDASRALEEATQELEDCAGLPRFSTPRSPTPFDVGSVCSSALQGRLDAFFHSHYHRDALDALKKADTKSLAELSIRIVEPARFKRVPVEDKEYGVPFFGTSALFWTEPLPSYFLARSMRNLKDYLVDKRCLLIPRSGQLSGIIGSIVLPYGDIVGGAVTEDAIRVYFDSEIDAGFAFVALTSEYGRRQLKARAFGSSIPHLDVKHIGRVRVALPVLRTQQAIGAKGARVGQLRDEAVQAERQAVRIVEDAIEKGATT